MEAKKINIRFGVLVAIIGLVAISRLIPHMPNFSPVGAIGLFGAAHFTKKWQAFLIPIAAIWISDLFIINVIYQQYYPSFTWFYQGFYWQYGSYALITLTGLFIFRKVDTQKVLAGALISTTIFFIITNFGCFLSNPIYPKKFGGLMICYLAGVPFLSGTLLGNLFYSAVLFGSFALLQQRYPILKFIHSK